MILVNIIDHELPTQQLTDEQATIFLLERTEITIKNEEKVENVCLDFIKKCLHFNQHERIVVNDMLKVSYTSVDGGFIQIILIVLHANTLRTFNPLIIYFFTASFSKGSKAASSQNRGIHCQSEENIVIEIETMHRQSCDTYLNPILTTQKYFLSPLISCIRI